MNLSTSRQVIVLVVLLAMLGLVSAFSKYQVPNPRGQQKENLGERVPDLPVPPPPPMSASMQAVLEASKGFSMFVSYTDNGFEPGDVSIKKGETVRFTNNSSQKVWISAVQKNGTIYPADHESCGQSAFDTCKGLDPYEIWEFTFTEPGVWGYRNNVEQTHVGVIHVK